MKHSLLFVALVCLFILAACDQAEVTQDLSEGSPQTFVLSFFPHDVLVTIADYEDFPALRGKVELMLPPGSYELLAEAEGFLPLRKTVDLVEGERLHRMMLEPIEGKAKMRVSLAGDWLQAEDFSRLQVWVNGEEARLQRDVLSGLRYGRNEVTVKDVAGAEWSGVLFIRAEEMAELLVEMRVDLSEDGAMAGSLQ